MTTATEHYGRPVRVYWNKAKKRATVVDATTNKRICYDTVVVVDDAVITPKKTPRGKAYVDGKLAGLGEDYRDAIPLRTIKVPGMLVVEEIHADRAFVHSGTVVLDGAVSE
jgi:hypothetical protein